MSNNYPFPELQARSYLDRRIRRLQQQAAEAEQRGRELIEYDLSCEAEAEWQRAHTLEQAAVQASWRYDRHRN